MTTNDLWTELMQKTGRTDDELTREFAAYGLEKASRDDVGDYLQELEEMEADEEYRLQLEQEVQQRRWVDERRMRNSDRKQRKASDGRARESFLKWSGNAAADEQGSTTLKPATRPFEEVVRNAQLSELEDGYRISTVDDATHRRTGNLYGEFGRQYGSWGIIKLLSPSLWRTRNAEYYAVCENDGCKKVHVVVLNNLKAGKSKQCRACSNKVAVA